MSGGGLMGDAQEIAFVFGKDTVEKIQARAELLHGASGLPLETKVELIGVLYGLNKEEILREMTAYVAEHFPEAENEPMRVKFNAWWHGIIARERRDLSIVLAKMQRGG